MGESGPCEVQWGIQVTLVRGRRYGKLLSSRQLAPQVTLVAVFVKGQMDDPDYVLEQETEAVENCSDSASQILRAWVEGHPGLKGVRASCSTTKSFEDAHGEAKTRYVFSADLVGLRKLTDVKMSDMTITTEQALDPMPFHLENSVVYAWNPFWHKNLLPGEKVTISTLSKHGSS